MSDDNYGFDFNNDGKVSFTESYMTYHIERETARNNSLYDSLSSKRNSNHTPYKKSGNVEKQSNDGSWIIYLILGASALGWIVFFIEKVIGIK